MPLSQAGAPVCFDETLKEPTRKVEDEGRIVPPSHPDALVMLWVRVLLVLLR
jgi:hypothetical protein